MGLEVPRQVHLPPLGFRKRDGGEREKSRAKEGERGGEREELMREIGSLMERGYPISLLPNL